MPRPHPVVKLREIERGLGLLAAEVEDLLGTRPANLLYWRRELRGVIAQLEDGGWPPTARSPERARPHGPRP